MEKECKRYHKWKWIPEGVECIRCGKKKVEYKCPVCEVIVNPKTHTKKDCNKATKNKEFRRRVHKRLGF